MLERHLPLFPGSPKNSLAVWRKKYSVPLHDKEDFQCIVQVASYPGSSNDMFLCTTQGKYKGHISTSVTLVQVVQIKQRDTDISVLDSDNRLTTWKMG